MIAVPRAADQFGNAAQLAAAGVGVVIDVAEVTVARLRQAAAELDTDQVRRRSAELAEELRTAGGASRAADLIEQVSPADQPTRSRH